MRRVGLVLLLGLSVLCFAQEYAADPDPSRFDNDIRLFQRWNSKNSVPDNAALFIGSSSIRMWYTADGFPEIPVINRGFGGAHISDIQHFYDTVVKPFNPKVIVFYCGDNDVAAGKPAKQVLEDYIELIKRIKKEKPRVKFIYLPIKPTSSRWQFWPEMVKTNQLIKEYNETQKWLYYVDTATPLLDENGKPDDKLLLDDKLHLNQDGYDVWQETLKPLLYKLMKRK